MTEQSKAEQELTELCEILYNFMKDGLVDYNNIKGTIQSFLITNHYVQLAEDQTQTICPYGYNEASYNKGTRDMSDAGWRKIKEEKDGKR